MCYQFTRSPRFVCVQWRGASPIELTHTNLELCLVVCKTAIPSRLLCYITIFLSCCSCYAFLDHNVWLRFRQLPLLQYCQPGHSFPTIFQSFHNFGHARTCFLSFTFKPYQSHSLQSVKLNLCEDHTSFAFALPCLDICM